MSILSHNFLYNKIIRLDVSVITYSKPLVSTAHYYKNLHCNYYYIRIISVLVISSNRNNSVEIQVIS